VSEQNSKTVAGFSIDEISKLVGIGAIMAYIIGYLVFSYYLSTFGMMPSSPFRPRVLETGIVSLIFLGVPSVIGAAVAFIPTRGASRIYIFLLRILVLPTACAAAVATPGFLRSVPSTFLMRTVATHSSRSREFIAATLAVAVIAVLTFGLILPPIIKWLWVNFHKKRIIVPASLLAIAIFFIYVGIGYSFHNPQTRFFFWFLCVSGLACANVSSVADSHHRDKRMRDEKRLNAASEELEPIEEELGLRERRSPTNKPTSSSDRVGDMVERVKELRKSIQKQLEEIAVPTSLAALSRSIIIYNLGVLPLTFSMFALAIFTNEIYPYVPFRYGGGQRVKIVIEQKRGDETLPSIDAELLDQNDDGLLVVIPGESGGSFIPKEKIDKIKYLHNLDDDMPN